MKYLPLIWSELFRRKTRTILTLLSILAAFLLFGLLNGVRTSFAEAGQSANGSQRLQTQSRLSFIQTLPLSLLPAMRQVDALREVTYANWLAGAYTAARNHTSRFALARTSTHLYPPIEVTATGRGTSTERHVGRGVVGTWGLMWEA